MADDFTTPCLFLSHSGADTAAAQTLKHRILETETARQVGLRVWLDKDDLVPSAVPWQRQIEVAIETVATCFAVLVGSAGVLNWVENEVRLGLSRATGNQNFAFVPILSREVRSSSVLPAFARQFQVVRDPLNDEKALAALVKAAIESRSIPNSTIVLVERPFVGLQTITENNSDLFFGRGAEIEDLIKIMSQHNITAIVADSGSGKSSLAQAGFIPAFRGGRLPTGNNRAADPRIRHVVVMRPGSDPLEGLRLGVTRAAEGLGRDEERRSLYRSKIDFSNPSETAYQIQCGLPSSQTLTLLIVDQFEEALIGQRNDQNIRFGFLLDFLSNRPNFRILLTVRQDYFNLIQRFGNIYAALTADNQAAVLRLKRISDDGIVDIIRCPLALAGYQRDDPDVESLVTLIRKDMTDRAGDLTLVQATLDAVWRNRLTAGGLSEAYAKVGGVAGAIANEADATRNILSTVEQKNLLGVFSRLIRPGETAGATRRIALLSTFSEANRGLAQKLAGPETAGGERLAPLLFVGEYVEIAHEALITQWGWLQENLQIVWPSIRQLDRLIDRAAAWSAAPDVRKPDYLATGAELRGYLDLANSCQSWLSIIEIAFVSGSERASKKAARTRRRNWVVVVSGIAAVILAFVVGLASIYWNVSNYEMSRAFASRSDAEAATRDAQYEKAMRFALNGLPPPKLSTMLTELASTFLSEALLVRLLSLLCDNRAIQEMKNLEPILASSAEYSLLRHTLDGHTGPVRSIAFNSDGSKLITASDDHTVKIWNGGTGAFIDSLPVGGQVMNASFSPDKIHIVTASSEGDVYIWTTEASVQSAKKTKIPINLTKGKVWDARYSSDGTRIITASDDGFAVWDARNPESFPILRSKDGPVLDAVFSTDGTRIAATSEKTASIYDASNGALIVSLRGDHLNRVRSVALNTDGTRLVTASFDNTAQIWDAITGDHLFTLVHSGPVIHADFSSDGQRIVTASWDGAARVWDAATGMELFYLNGHGAEVVYAAFGPGGTTIVTASTDGTARIWDTNKTLELNRFKVRHGQILTAFFVDSAHLATVSSDQSVRIWDISNPKAEKETMLLPHSAKVTGATLSYDGTKIVTAAADGVTRVWNASTGVMIQALEDVETETLSQKNVVNHAAFNHDGTKIVTASSDGYARVWDMKTGKLIHRFAHVLTDRDNIEKYVTVRWASFSPNGEYIVTASDDKEAHVWNLATEKQLVSLRGHRSIVSSAVFSSDGGLIVTSSWDHTARIWDAASGKPILLLQHSGLVNEAEFSGDGSRVLTASWDRTARVWDTATGTELVRFVGHFGDVRSAAFGPDRGNVVTSSEDGTVRIWDATWLIKLHGEELAKQVCSERLVGSTSKFLPQDALTDPILSDLAEQDPCRFHR